MSRPSITLVSRSRGDDRDGWRLRFAAVPDSPKHKDVQEMNHTERDQQDAQLAHQQLYRLNSGRGRTVRLEDQKRIAQVEHVETNNQQPIDRFGHHVLVEHIVEKDRSILEERSSEPHSQADRGD